LALRRNYPLLVGAGSFCVPSSPAKHPKSSRLQGIKIFARRREAAKKKRRKKKKKDRAREIARKILPQVKQKDSTYGAPEIFFRFCPLSSSRLRGFACKML